MFKLIFYLTDANCVLLLSFKNHLPLQQLEKKEQSKGHRLAASRGQRSLSAGRHYKVCISRLMFYIGIVICCDGTILKV